MFGRMRRREEAEIDEETYEFDVEAEVTTGPYDAADVPEDDEVKRLNLGSILIPTLSGVQIGVTGDERGNPRPELQIQTSGSMLRLVVCAAPRSEGIWDEVRGEIGDTLKRQGGTIEEFPDGEFGTELVAKQPAGKDGKTTVRVVGVNGPRWFLRGTFLGDRAADPSADTVLDETLRGIVVNRGTDAMPVKEPLPLRLTPEMSAQVRQKQEAAAAEEATAAPEKNGPASKRKPAPKPRKR